MQSGSFADYLAGVDQAALVDLLRKRPDVRVEPVPRGFVELSERLGGADSLVRALRLLNRDSVVVGQMVAALTDPTTERVARLLDVPEGIVQDVVADLCDHGLAWLDSDTIRLPKRLAAHWSAEVGSGRPLVKIARSVLVEDLRAAAEALGIGVAGLRKPELITSLGQTLADAPAVAAVVGRLPEPARARLDQFRHGVDVAYWGDGMSRVNDDVNRVLAAAGLVLRVNGRWELPDEVAVAAWLTEQESPVTGPPEIPHAAATPAEVRTAGHAAIHDVLRGVTGVLDTARSSPITALKKGGVGSRERSRLAARLALPAEMVLLAIDLAHAAGLVGRVESGYAPTATYANWRDSDPASQWAVLATAWFDLEHAPTSRESQDGKEQPPPLPLASTAGVIRRALLRAAHGGRSVEVAGAYIDWFSPVHGYDATECQEKVDAAMREGRMLGVLDSDVVTELGEQLLVVADGDLENPVQELVNRVASMVPEAPCTMVVQSDLTAVVSGYPSARTMSVLGAAAVCETRGAASVWRFTPDSARHALDTGWTAHNLRDELAALADQPLPQPLSYLIADAGRRHGQVRVRGLRSCVLADEATVTEILHTRRLAKLQLAALAPTVLSSPCELDEVLTKLREAGFAPVTENGQGTVTIEHRHDHQAPTTTRPVPTTGRARSTAADLAGRLLADPAGDADGGTAASNTFRELAALDTPLSGAELALLADALDQGRDVSIVYCDKNGSRTWRDIGPRELYGRWLDSWCHLRNGQRDFTVANIESVAPA